MSLAAARATDHTVLEFARAPIPGRVKTRLARTEGPVEAARIYRVLAGDVHRALVAHRREHGTRLIAYGDATGTPDALALLGRWLHGADAVWRQPPGDLGRRMEEGFRRAFHEGAERVLAVGTDVVGVTPDLVARAFALLDDADVVLAPVPDGGYGLIGLACPAPSLLYDVPWGTAVVADVTRARAREAGWTVTEITGLGDVDRESDLEGAVPLVSVLVPVLDEAERLGRLLRDLNDQAEAWPAGTLETVVIDGGSTDASMRVAHDGGARVLESPPGRGIQLGRGASAARGRWLWTLHADARLEAGAVEKAVRHARRREPPWACFDMRIDQEGAFFRGIERMNELRARTLRLPYGDQGVLVRRAIFDRVGGYAALPLMEDVELARRLRAYGPPAWLGPGLVVDARRWTRLGPGRATVLNLALLTRHLVLGEDPARLAAAYRRG